jgi:hypothetical protein
MAKRIDPAKAKAARQKKIAIVLGVVLLAVVAFQGPKTLKMLKGPAPAAAPAPVTGAPTTGVTVPPLGAPAATASAPTAGQPAVLASSDQLPAPGAGQLLSFERFASKDPFVQQVSAAAMSEPAQEPAKADGDATPPPIVPAADATSGPGQTAVPPSSGSGSTPPAQPQTAPPAASTTISVNGVSEPVGAGSDFPLEDPIFVLVSTASDGKSVQIGIAGGTYADGKDTIMLKLGKPLTLQNTSDGSRYELLLETVAGFAPPAAKK